MGRFGDGTFGSGSFGGAIASPPANLSLPTVAGNSIVTATLSGAPGVWDQIASFQYQWQRTISAVTTNIPGAIGTTYTLTATDLTATITLKVTATASGGSTVAYSVPVGPVQDYVPPPNPTVSVTRPWTFVVTDLAGIAVGEPLAEGRTFSPGVSRTETAGFQVKVGSRLWQDIAAGAAMLKVYNSNDQLVFWGDIVTDELSADASSQTVAFTAADLSFRLSKRYVGKSGVGVAYANTDVGQVVFSELDTANAEFPTGISSGIRETFYQRTVTLTFRRFSDMLADLGSATGSYEWTLRYVDGTPPLVFLDLEGQAGSDVSSAVFFEYGTGLNNCQSYRRVRSLEQVATRVYAQSSGATNSVVAYDPGAETVRRFEDVISTADITDTSLLDSLAAAHVAFRHQPRRTVQVSPFPALSPRYGVDWWRGDIVTLRGVVGGVVDTDGTARVWSAQIALDEFGNEQATPTLEPDA